jgi:hypothetical protein
MRTCILKYAPLIAFIIVILIVVIGIIWAHRVFSSI